MDSSQFEISIVAADGVLLMGVRVPESATEDDIDTVMGTLIEAFATVERVDETEMQHLLFTQGAAPRDYPARGNPFEFVLRREYSDPEYPVKIDCVLQRLTSDAPTLH